MKNPQKFKYAHCDLDFVLPIGKKHKGETLKYIIAHDPSYMNWLMRAYIIHVDTGSEASKYIFTKLGDWQAHRYDWTWGFPDVPCLDMEG